MTDQQEFHHVDDKTDHAAVLLNGSPRMISQFTEDDTDLSELLKQELKIWK